MNHTANMVLIVEDSRAINNMLTDNISALLHIDVRSATTMQEALKILEKNKDKFFVAILDLNLPDAPHGEIVDLVLQYDIPPIILTGSISDDLHDAMTEKSIIDYVVKRNLNEIEYVIEAVRRLRDNKGRKVLVVDDSKSSRLLISSLLERQYLNVFQASNGLEALKILETHKDIILIVTDYNMDKMDGMELTTKVREKYSRNELAIIGISTTGTGTVSIKLLKSGANDFITRPFMHEEFYCRINQNIDSIMNYRMLRDSADRDFLTGLYNRKYLFNTGSKLFQNAKRNNITLMVAMLDIDFFKNVNDTHGHQVGDMALKHTTAMFTTQLRETDFIARIGGEEFCLICVNTDSLHAADMLERYRKSIADNPLQIDGLTLQITVSIGYTMELKDSLDHMINDADSALYEAKEGGRNQVVRFITKE